MVWWQEHIQARSSRLAPRKFNHTYVTGLALALSLVVAGCATAPEKTVEEPAVEPAPDVVELPKETPPSAVDSPDKAPTQTQPDGADILEKQPEQTDEMVTVSVYTIDAQCNDFVEETVQVPIDQAMNQAVGKAVGAVEYNAFKLAGYQVNLNGSTATVDMQLAPGSERQFVSLSSCEQRALFGSVEETLLNNPDWNVDAVKFTDGGKELVL
ncbi:MAG: sporulation/spore germination protein [Cyanobacteria bacterium J06623_5]